MKGNFQHLQTGLDNTKLEGNIDSTSMLVAEKYSGGRITGCFTSITCTPCIVKKPTQTKKHFNVQSYQNPTKQNDHYGESYKHMNLIEDKQNEEFKMFHDYEEQKFSERYDNDQTQHRFNIARAQMEFDVTDVVRGKST